MCTDVRMIEVWFVMCQSFYLRSMSINKHLGLTKSTRIISCFSLLQYNSNKNHSQSNRRAVNRPNELQLVDSSFHFTTMICSTVPSIWRSIAVKSTCVSGGLSFAFSGSHSTFLRFWVICPWSAAQLGCINIHVSLLYIQVTKYNPLLTVHLISHHWRSFY